MSGRYAFAKGLKEVRFLFCQTGEHSAATRYVCASGLHWQCLKYRILINDCCWCRSFLSRAYPIMKKNNPSTPIMLREAQGTLPKIYARYGPFSTPRSLSRTAIIERRNTDILGRTWSGEEPVTRRYSLHLRVVGGGWKED